MSEQTIANKFEKASRVKLRFDTGKGLLTVEDLWDLPLRGNGISLNTLAKILNRKIKDEGEEDFITPSTPKNDVLELQFDLVKYVIGVKLDEREVADMMSERREKKQKLLEVLSRKKDAMLEQTPVEDLEKMLADL